MSKVAAELKRGWGLAKSGGVSAGCRFVLEEVLRNSWLRLSAGLPRGEGRGVRCNVCGWRGGRFLSHCAVGYVDRNAFCPRCKSYPRHRGFAWLWERRLAGELGHLKSGQGKKVMFAPERGMLSLLEPVVGSVEGADIDASNPLVVYREDLQRLSFGDGSVDLISCFHVLEHVPDDGLALGEMRRVLSPEGRLILCVPITLGRRETWEFDGPNPLLNDHCYDYGEDFPQRLEAAGFSGHSYRIDELVPEEDHRRLAITKESFFVLERGPEGAGRVVPWTG